MAEEYGGMEFIDEIKTYEKDIPQDLYRLMGSKPKEIFDYPDKWGNCKRFTLSENLTSTRAFRNKYVHWSARNKRWELIDDMGYELRTNPDTYIPEREVHSG